MFQEWSHAEIWALVALILWLAEVFVPGMILGCLGTGALGGLLAAAFGGSLEVQLIAASAATVFAFMFLRPLTLKRWFKGADVRTGVEALVGREAVVTAAFDPKTHHGRCKVDGDDWAAIWSTPTLPPPSPGDAVRISSTSSNTLIVEPLNFSS